MLATPAPVTDLVTFGWRGVDTTPIPEAERVEVKVVPPAAVARISPTTMLCLQDGAVSLMVTTVPLAEVFAVCIWPHAASPSAALVIVIAKPLIVFVCPVPGVGPVALV